MKDFVEQTRVIAREAKQLLSDVTKEVREVKVEVMDLKQEVQELKHELRDARQNDDGPQGRSAAESADGETAPR